MSDHSGLKRLAEASVGFCDVPIAPDVVLVLIYEVEGLSAQHGRDSAELRSLCQARDDARKERDQLKAEVERLKNRLEVDPRHDYDGISTRDATVKVLDEQVDQLKAENERLRADYAGLARFNPEWDRVAAAQDSVREHMAMVVQLKAENAGLKTGYEAYERVNAELKAEVEGLNDEYDKAWRHDLNDKKNVQALAAEVLRLSAESEVLRHALMECTNSLQGEMLQKFGGQLPEDMHPVTRREYDRDIAEVSGYRAALGQGEQS